MKRFEEELHALFQSTLFNWDGPGRACLDPFYADSARLLKLIDRLALHLGLCLEWTKRIDLVADASPDELVRRHVLDSVCAYAALSALCPHQLRFGTVVDVGSGAGFPGLVFAALSLDTPVVLIEPREQRAMFLKEARRRMQLPTVDVRAERFQDFDPGHTHKVRLVVARALGNYVEYATVASSILGPEGVAAVLAGPLFKEDTVRSLDYQLPDGAERRKIAVLAEL